MIILDTNVLSALMRTSPETAVVAWLDGQNAEFIWLTSITLFQTRLWPGAAAIGPAAPNVGRRVYPSADRGLKKPRVGFR